MLFKKKKVVLVWATFFALKHSITPDNSIAILKEKPLGLHSQFIELYYIRLYFFSL